MPVNSIFIVFALGDRTTNIKTPIGSYIDEEDAKILEVKCEMMGITVMVQRVMLYPHEYIPSNEEIIEGLL